MAGRFRKSPPPYVAMMTTVILTATAKPTVEQVAALAGAEIKESALEQAYEAAKKQYDDLGGDDTVAKGPKMLSNVTTEIIQGTLF